MNPETHLDHLDKEIGCVEKAEVEGTLQSAKEDLKKSETDLLLEQKNWPEYIKKRIAECNVIFSDDTGQNEASIEKIKQKDLLLYQSLASLASNQLKINPQHRELIHNLTYSQEPALLNPLSLSKEFIYSPDKQEGILLDINDIIERLKIKHPVLVGLIVLGSLSKGYWKPGSDFDWALVFDGDVNVRNRAHIIQEVKNDFQRLFREKITEKYNSELCCDNSFDILTFSLADDVHIGAGLLIKYLSATFNGYFIGDRERLKNIQREIILQISENQWDLIRKDWLSHLEGYGKLIERVGLSANEVAKIKLGRALLWSLPKFEEMKEYLGVERGYDKE